jgi:hypothetical protein
MNRRQALFPLALALALALALPAAAATPTTLVVPMDGDQVVGGGDPDGTGTATLTIDVKAETLCYSIQTKNVYEPEPDNPLNSAFISAGPRGEDGAIVVTLWSNPVRAHDHQGCGTIRRDPGKETRTLLKDMVKNPQDDYVQVTSEEFDEGAIRGQLG